MERCSRTACEECIRRPCVLCRLCSGGLTQSLRTKEACTSTFEISEGPVAFGCDGQVPVVLFRAAVVDDARSIQSVTKSRTSKSYM